MKIDSVRVIRVHMPRVDPTWRTASYADSAVSAFVLEVAADGVVGLGGAAAHPKSAPPERIEAELLGPVRAALLGADPLEGNLVRAALAKEKIHARSALAADLALLDLVGKLAKLPCHALWGGALRSHVTVVRMVGIKPTAELEGAVGQLVGQGFTHMKVKIGTGIEEDVERIRALSRAFGKSIWIGVDGNGAYAPEEAIELSRALEPFDVRLIEQPVDYRDLEGLRRVTAASSIPIMADQCVYDIRSAMAVCQRRAAHVVSIKATKMGSLDECRRVFELCRSFGIRSHLGGSAGPAIVDVAQAQLAASLQGMDEECEVGEFLAVTNDPMEGVTVRGGKLELSSSPGWGLRLVLPSA